MPIRPAPADPLLIRPITIADSSGDHFVVPGWSVATVSNSDAVVDYLYVMPIYVATEMSFDQAWVSIFSTPGASTGRMGVYNNGGDSPADFKPSTLVQDFGTVDTSSTGSKSITGLSLTLARGWYWLAWASGGSNNPKPVSFAVASMLACPMGATGNSGVTAPEHMCLRSYNTHSGIGSSGFDADVSGYSWLRQYPDTIPRIMLRLA